jgi:hypothetical protein
MRLNAPILEYFTAKSLYRITRNLTLNQRVECSIPCASTNDFNGLYGGIFAILATGQPLIVANALYSFALHAAFGRQR